MHFDIVHESGLEFDGTTAILHYFCPYAKYFGCSVKVWEGSSDAAYADDLDTRRSFEGYLFKLFGGPIDWKATCQFTVTTSTTEAELLAACHAGKEIFAWRRIFAQFGFDFGEDLDLVCDNKMVTNSVANEAPMIFTRLPHVDIHQLWLRERVQEGSHTCSLP